MNVAIRADASSRIGSGHVRRCKTLADQLRQRGATVRFVCREQPGHLIRLLTDDGYRVEVLPADVDAQSADADATSSALDRFGADWLVVDHYGLGQEWETRLRPEVGGIFVIDDLANRGHDCDLLLDQNWFGGATPFRYDALVPAHCRRLLGPRYALLHPVFAQLRESLPLRDGVVRRLLVFFGAVDSSNQTATVLRALQAEDFAALGVDVVVGHANPHAIEIESMIGQLPYGAIHRELPTLAALMARADVMTGAGGSTTWERCCLGLPAIVAVTADNQEGLTAAVAASGAQHSLGRAGGVNAEHWAAALRESQKSPSSLKASGEAARLLTDGRGAARVSAAMLPVLEQPRLRRAYSGGGAAPASWSLEVDDSRGAPIGRVLIAPDGKEEALVHINVEAAPGDDSVAAALLRHALSVVAADGTFLRSNHQPLRPRGGNRHDALRLTVLTDRTSWLNDRLEALLFEWFARGDAVRWVHDPAELEEGDVCFVLSCSTILTAEHLARHRHTLVVHESDLPRGRGWSPLTWQVLEGANRIPVTLLEASREVDAGPIYLQRWITLDGTELVDELRARQADATIQICREWLANYPSIIDAAVPQAGVATSYRRRVAADSELDPAKPLRDQFGLLRVVDNHRYPAFFSHGGARYVISIRKDKAAG